VFLPTARIFFSAMGLFYLVGAENSFKEPGNIGPMLTERPRFPLLRNSVSKNELVCYLL